MDTFAQGRALDGASHPQNNAGRGQGIATGARARRDAIIPRALPKKKLGAVGGVSKRAFDILISAALIVFLAPALITLAALVRLESRGPAIFTQRRGGLNGDTFNIFKFRTMTVCDDGPTIVQATYGDARVTKLGGFLRRSSLDELPQLFNVLRGDMSIVGPRPHALAHDKAFAEIDARYELRMRARPGITGLAQISGARGPTSTQASVSRRVSFDLDYIAHWSFWLDVKIIARTVWRLFTDGTAF